MRSKLWSLRRLALCPSHSALPLQTSPSILIRFLAHHTARGTGLAAPVLPPLTLAFPCLPTPGIPGDIPAITTSASMDRPFVQTAPNSPEAMEVDVDIPEVSRIPSAEDRFEAHSQASPSPRSAPLAQRIKASPHLPTPQRSVFCTP